MGYTPLMLAIMLKDLSLVRALLEDGKASVNLAVEGVSAQRRHNNSPLAIAYRYGDSERKIFQYLLSSRANANAQLDVRCAVVRACL